MTTLSWTGTLKLFTVALLAMALALTAVQLTVDPLGIWWEPVQGFNQAKEQQRTVERTFKAYQHANRKPAVVLFGTSRVGRGVPASWPGYDDEEVYNHAFSEDRIQQMIPTIDHVIRTHRPELIVIGLDLNTMQKVRDPERLSRHAGWDPYREVALERGIGLPYRLRDGVFSIDTLSWVWPTLRDSRAGVPAYNVRGYRADWGEGPLSRGRWYGMTKYYFDARRNLRLPHSMIDRMGQAIKRWRAMGIEVRVLLMPEHADIVAQAHHLPRVRRELEAAKRRLAHHTPYWDFFQVDAWTREPTNFSDVAHPRGVLGRRIVRRMNDGRGGPGHRVDRRSVDDVLKRQRRAAQEYLDEHEWLHDLITTKQPKGVVIRRLKRQREWLRPGHSAR